MRRTSLETDLSLMQESYALITLWVRFIQGLALKFAIQALARARVYLVLRSDGIWA